MPKDWVWSEPAEALGNDKDASVKRLIHASFAADGPCVAASVLSSIEAYPLQGGGVLQNARGSDPQAWNRVEKALEEAELSQLGKTMKARFEEVLAGGFAAAVPKTMAKTSADVSRRSAKRSRSAA
jgi:hypothetical protein